MTIGLLVLLSLTTFIFTSRAHLCLCALLLFWVELAQAATVNNVRVWRAEEHTRIVLDMDAPVSYTLVLANNPTRIILDVANTTLNASLEKLPLATTPVEIVRSSVVNDTDLRLVFDLKTPVAPKSFQLKKLGDNNDRLVIDLYAGANATNVSSTTNPENSAQSEPVNIEALLGDANADSEKASATTTAAVASNSRPILIAVDAGHGGADSGALGPKNMREKDVTLSLARELVRIINAQPGYSARLTRTGDYFIELQKRRDFARDMKADLFISVHADSFTDPSAYGASVFALSRKGATSEMARFLAQRENDSDLIGRVGGVSLEDKDPQLAGVLVDLSMTATVNSSLQVGSKVLSSISAIAPLHAKHVEQAGFMVLKSPDVPSILVETGFISNTSEAKKLASPEYRERMAQAIFKGVKQYFTQHPPALAQPSSACCSADRVRSESAATERNSGVKKSAERTTTKKSTATKNNSSERRHLVVRGDTLTDLAVRYGVSARKIKAANNMKTDSVKLGQTLKIPAQ